MVKEDNKKTINQNNTNINDINDRYDATLKEIFDDEVFVKELILYFVAENWVKDIDFNTLKKEKTDFLSEDLKEFRKDLLWSVKLKEQKVYFFIHIEFQSTSDRRMPFRFLNYNSLLYIDIIKKRTEGKKGKKHDIGKLPFIFPILFYIGDKDWNFELDLTKLIEQPFDNSINYIPKFDIFKIMLNKKSLKELKEIDCLLSNVLATDNKEINKDDLDIIIAKLINILSEFSKEKEILLKEKINKFFKIISNEKIDMTEAINILNKEATMGGFMAMMKREKEESKLEGIEQGIEQGKLELAKRMLIANLDIHQISEITGLSIKELEKL